MHRPHRHPPPRSMEPPRLVDYFVDVVADVVPVLPAKCGSADYDDFDRRIARRIPVVDHADFPLPDGVPFFCVPSCLSAVDPSAYERKPTFFSFSLTGGDGSRAYGFALHFYERSSDQWCPRVFCIISHHPFFSLFKEIVTWVYRRRTHSSEQRVVESILADASDQRSWFLSPRASKSGSAGGKNGFALDLRPPTLCRTASDSATGDAASVELALTFVGVSTPLAAEHDDDLVDRILTQLVLEAECPCPGGVFDLRLEGHDFFRYHVQRGNVPHLDDYCFQVLFQCLSIKNVVYIINCMLLEQRILIHSNHHGLLTPVCEALCALMFPFAWEHVYVPFLPVKLIEYLQAPVPYLMGLHTSSLATRIGAEIFSSCVVVHLDKGKVVTPISSRIDESPVDFVLARLPAKEVDALLHTVEHLTPQPINGSNVSSHNSSSASNSPSTRGSCSSPLKHVVDSANFSQPSSLHSEVELTFGDGPLGITFESTHLRLLAVSHFQLGRQPGTSAVVKALPRLQNGLPGPAERSGLVRPGSFLVGINGVSTLDFTFEETIDRLRVEKRPVRLRFLNASAPHENACRFAERLQGLSLVSALQIDHSNTLHTWVDTVRGAFAVLFTSIFRDFQRFICIEHITNVSPFSGKRSTPSTPRNPAAQSPAALRRRRSSTMSFSVTFDHASFCEAACFTASSPGVSQSGSSGSSAMGFLREFTQTQSFAGFVNDSVMGRISHTTIFPQLELFHQCIHLHHELGDPTTAAQAISLLFERDHTAIETIVLDLPRRSESVEEMAAVGQSPTHGPARKSTVVSASPLKRTSKTRQLEMIICGSAPEPNPSGAELTLASLNSELHKSIEPVDALVPPLSIAVVPTSSPMSFVSLSSSRRTESLSSTGSTSTIDGEDSPFHDSGPGVSCKQLNPEDPLVEHSHRA